MRKLKILFALFFILSLSHASIYIYFPVSSQISDGGILYIGKLGKSHVVRLIFNAEDPSPILSVDTTPEANTVIRDGRLWITFQAPSSPGRYYLDISVERNTGMERYTIAYDVVEKPLLVELPSPTVSIPEAGTSNFSVGIVNTSLGSTKVRVSCPRCPAVEVPIPPKETKVITLSASSTLSGDYNEEITVIDLYSGEKYTSPVTFVVYPTIEGRVRSVYLLPDVFLPVLYPFRLFLGVLFWRT